MRSAQVDQRFHASRVAPGSRAMKSCQSVFVRSTRGRRSSGSEFFLSTSVKDLRWNDPCRETKANYDDQSSIPCQSQYGLHATRARRPQDWLSPVFVLRVYIRAEFQERLQNLQTDLLGNRELGCRGRTATLSGVMKRRTTA